jgi:uncharacterized membrane protein
MNILLHGNVDHYLGLYHPVLVHFPIVLFTLTLICDLLNGAGKVRAFKVANWMLLGGVVMSIPTIIAGWEASESFPPGDPIVQKHMILAFTTASFALLYGLFRYSMLLKQRSVPPLVFVALSIVLVTLTLWTSDYGGLLSHGITPFSNAH